MKRLGAFLLAAVLTVGLLCGCDSTISSANDTMKNDDAEKLITLTGSGAESRAGGVSIKGSTVTLSAAGSYTVTGKLDDGQIVVDTGEDAGKVTLILDNADITNLSGPAIHVVQAKKLDLFIADGSQNTVRSGAESSSAQWNESSRGAAIYAEDDLDIEANGEGVLSVYGYINSGIVCKDDIEIKCGESELAVVAVNNGIKGSESVTVSSGSLRIEAGKDGIKATSASKEGKGFVTVSGGSLSVHAGGDGISAETELTVSGGSVAVITDGDPGLLSCKALKGKTGVSITDGAVSLSSSDHAIHSSAGLTVSGGAVTVSSSAKGFAAHSLISFNGGTVSADTLDDAIECKGDIRIEGGSIELLSGADGIKAGKNGQGGIAVSGGQVLVSAKNDPFDAQSELTVKAGTLLAVGFSKRLKSFSESSTQGFIASQTYGAKDDTVTAGGSTVTAASPFNVVLFSAPGVLPGSEISFTVNTKTVTETAR